MKAPKNYKKEDDILKKNKYLKYPLFIHFVQLFPVHEFIFLYSLLSKSYLKNVSEMRKLWDL
jgi:hypothetical protein